MTNYFHIPLDEGAGTSARVISNVVGIAPGTTLTGDAGQWDGTDRWQGNGASFGIEFTFGAAIETIFPAGEEAFLIGCRFRHTTEPSAIGQILRMGQTTGGTTGAGLELRQASNDRVQLAIWRQDESALQTETQDVETPLGTEDMLFVFVDNRSTGAKTATFYDYTLGTTTSDPSAPLDITVIGQIMAGAVPEMQIGFKRNASGNAQQFIDVGNGIADVQLYNFGQTVPDVVALMDDISTKGGKPDSATLDLAGVVVGGHPNVTIISEGNEAAAYVG